jgi:hypothetical protein
VATAPSVAELLDGHVSLDVECFDRLYLNAYVPKLQTGGGTVRFLRDQRGYPIPSPALFGQMGDRFRAAVKGFAGERAIPLVRFKAGERKIAAMTPLLERASEPGVVAIGTAQETQWVTMGSLVGRTPSGTPCYGFRRAERRVSVFYFYIADADWGHCFIKLCAYFPYPGKVWCNGHEYAKRQLERRGIAYEALANGFRSCAEPEVLAEVTASIGPEQVQALVDRWMGVIPLPLTGEDRAAGYDWELSMRQVEVSRTLVLDRPARARAFFERVVEASPGLGRHDEVELIFARRVQRNTPGRFSTRIVHAGVEPRISIHYKSCRVKEYLKEGRAIRVETVINNPTDVGVKRRIAHLGVLGDIGRQVNRRILDAQRVAAAPGPSTALFERVALPDKRAGHRTVALRYGDPRAMCVMAALCLVIHQVAGIRNRSLRPLVEALLGAPYPASRMSYDLWRLRTKGLLTRLPRTHTWLLTPDGLRIALFYAKSYRRMIDPLFAAAAPDAPSGLEPELRCALRTIEDSVDRYVREAQLAA